MHANRQARLRTAAVASATTCLLITGYLLFTSTSWTPYTEVVSHEDQRGMPRKTGVDPVTAPEKEIGRLPVDVSSGGAVFEIHYAAPDDAGSAKVIVAPELAARSLRSDASVYVVGEVGSDGVLRVAEPDWAEAQSNRGESRAFYAP